MNRWWRRLRVDLAQPETPVGRDLLAVGFALGITVIAQLADPGEWYELVGLLPVVASFVALGLGARLRMELLAAISVVATSLVVGNQGNLEVSLLFPVLATLYSAWFLGSVARAGLIMVGAGIASWLVATQAVPESGIGYVPWAVANVFTFVMGLTLRQQRNLIQQLDEARDELMRQALADERRRIARELHDLAGHTLAAMLLHVTGARHVLRRDPAEAEQALVDAETVGRASLDQVRATVAALRTDESGTEQALPGPAQLGELADAYRRAGLRIECHVGDGVAVLDGPVGTALYRITQESLANVARHAPGNKVTVLASIGTTGEGAEVTLSVTDQGSAPATVEPSQTNFGLIGMRERARAMGGTLVAGPTGDGWRVEASLPLVAPVPAGADPS